MNDAVRDEILEQIDLDVKGGFENEQQLYDSIKDMMYNEEIDDEWLELVIKDKYQKHQVESRSWKRPTDFDRLAAALDELIAEKIVCLHNAGNTKSDGEEDCMGAIENLRSMDIETKGFCYYHSQDLSRAVDPEQANLFLGFDSWTQNDGEALALANRIVEVLRKHNFQVEWPGTVNQRIKIFNLNWQKVPDDQPWGEERVIKILTATQQKSPFWKFW